MKTFAQRQPTGIDKTHRPGASATTAPRRIDRGATGGNGDHLRTRNSIFDEGGSYEIRVRYDKIRELVFDCASVLVPCCRAQDQSMIIRDQIGETLAFPPERGFEGRKMGRYLPLNATPALGFLGRKGRYGTEIHAVDISVASGIALGDGVVEATCCPV